MSNRAQANPCLCTAQFNYIYLLLISKPKLMLQILKSQIHKGKGKSYWTVQRTTHRVLPPQKLLDVLSGNTGGTIDIYRQAV